MAAVRRSEAARRSLRPRTRGRVAAISLAVVLAGIIGLYAATQLGGSASGGSGSGYAYVVGGPGPGDAAPPFELASSQGGTFALSEAAGDTTLVYFQEGLTCQPCWDQIRELEQNTQLLSERGITRMVSITTDPAPLVRRKTEDEGIESPVLSDPDARVSDAYDARRYSMDMMRPLRNGHSFMIIRDGRIAWRADYGGAPDYTMFVPAAALAADIGAGSKAPA